MVLSLGLLSGADVREAGTGWCAMECQGVGLLDGIGTWFLMG